MVVLFLTFWGNSILFSLVAAQIYIPTNSIWGLPFHHILTNTCVFFLIISILTGVRCYLTMGFVWFCFCLFVFKIFLMWTIFKVFIEFVTILLLFYVLVFWSQGMWDLSSPTRDRTHTPCIGRQSLNHWTAREVPSLWFWFVFPWWLVMLSIFSCACCPSICLLWKNVYSDTLTIIQSGFVCLFFMLSCMSS